MLQKTKVLTLIVFGLLFLNLSAQDDNFSNDKVAKLPDNDRKVRFGLHFSPNLSWLKANRTGYKNEGAKFGFSYGLAGEYFMSSNYLVSSGINILNTGGTITHQYENLTDIELIEDFKIKYVEVPILLKLRTNEIGYLTYYGQFGFNTAINISQKSVKEYNSTSAAGAALLSIINTKPNTTDINFMNVSLAIGAGVEYNISGNTSLNLGLIFSNGFIDQLDGDASANLNYVALTIGVFF